MKIIQWDEDEDEDDIQGKFEQPLWCVAWVHWGKRLQAVHHTSKYLWWITGDQNNQLCFWLTPWNDPLLHHCHRHIGSDQNFQGTPVEDFVIHWAKQAEVPFFSPITNTWQERTFLSQLIAERGNFQHQATSFEFTQTFTWQGKTFLSLTSLESWVHNREWAPARRSRCRTHPSCLAILLVWRKTNCCRQFGFLWWYKYI